MQFQGILTVFLSYSLFFFFPPFFTLFWPATVFVSLLVFTTWKKGVLIAILSSGKRMWRFSLSLSLSREYELYLNVCSVHHCFILFCGSSKWTSEWERENVKFHEQNCKHFWTGEAVFCPTQHRQTHTNLFLYFVLGFLCVLCARATVSNTRRNE